MDSVWIILFAVQVVVTLAVYFVKGQKYAAIYQIYPEWSGSSIAAFILTGPSITMTLYMALGMFGTAISVVYWLTGIVLVAFSDGPNEQPGIIESAFHGSMGPLPVWLGFMFGFKSDMAAQGDVLHSAKRASEHLKAAFSPSVARTGPSMSEELTALKLLHDSGGLTAEQFESAKSKVINKAA